MVFVFTIYLPFLVFFISSSPPSLCLSCIHYTDTYRTLILARVVRNLSANAGDVGSIPGEENGNPLQYSCLENPTDGGA